MSDLSQPSDARRPRALHISRSFSRLDSPGNAPESPSRLRASTIQTPTIHRIPEARDIASVEHESVKQGDIFETVDDDDDDGQNMESGLATDKKAHVESPATFDQLPIEIRSLTERYCHPALLIQNSADLLTCLP